MAGGTPELVVETNCAAKNPPSVTLEDASGTRISVTLSTTHRPGRMSAQYVFRPDRPLAVGAFVTVIKDPFQTSRQALEVVAPTSGPFPWSHDPDVGQQTEVELGCGPEKSVQIEVGTTAAPRAFVALEDLTDKQSVSGFIRVDVDHLVIGHGMCDGAFDLKKGHRYAASIALVQPDGVSSAAKPATFVYQPTMK